MTVHLTINGIEIEAEEKKTILDVARENGIYIPTLCYHSHLRPIGSCRLCVVDIEGTDVPKAACTTKISEGMKIHTNSGRVLKMRQQAMELILMHHPLDCPICDKGGECDLQDLSYEMGIHEQPYRAKKPEFKIQPFCTPLIRQWPERCVVCLRCVSVCKEVVGNAAISLKGTGYGAVITPVAPEMCNSCGECLSVCPVGALTEAVSPVRGRVWQIERTRTTCGQCGVGCQMEISTYENLPINVKTDDVVEEPPNLGTLCVRGRFFYDYPISKERLTQPKIRKGEEWIATDWDSAYEEAINHLRETIKNHGPDSVGMIVSSRLLNEDLMTLVAFARRGLKTPHVDGTYRLDLAPQLDILKALTGGFNPASLDRLKESQVVVVAGGDIDLNAQVVANRIRMAKRDVRNKVVVVNAFKTRLDKVADASLTCQVGTETPVFYGLIREALSDHEGLQKAEGWDVLSKQIEDYTAEAVCEAARIDPAQFKKAVTLIRGKGAETISFVVGTDLGRSPDGLQTLKALANLALACRAAGKTVHWIPLTAYANAWGTVMAQEMVGGDNFGLRYGEMIQAAHEGKLKALIIVEDDPLLSLPQPPYVEEALGKLEFLMVVDLFESRTAKLAHLLLPSTSFMEKAGSFVNMEGDLKSVTRLLEPAGEARDAAQIVMDLARKMKLDWEKRGEMTEIYEQWQRRTGDPLKGFFEVAYQPARVEENSHLFLMPSEFLTNHHYGADGQYVKAIGMLGKIPEFFMNPEDATRMGVGEGDPVVLSTPDGSFSVTPILSGEVKEGHIVVRSHYRDSGIRRLFPFVLDKDTGTPVTGVVRVKLQKS